MDEEEFEGFIALTYDSAYRVAMSWCHDTELSFDFVQDMFVNAWAQWNRTRNHDIWSWAYCSKVLVNAIKGSRRKQRVVLVLRDDDHDVDDHEDCSQYEWAMLVSPQVQNALDQLTSRQRQVIEALVFHGLKPAETANQLKLDRQSVHDYRRKALIKLGKVLSGRT